MKLLPTSLAGQLTLLLLLALAVAQGVAVGLFAWERVEAVRHAHRDSVILRTATVARLLQGTPPSLHKSVVTAASTDLVRFSVTEVPMVTSSGTGRQVTSIAGALSSVLESGQIRVAPLWTRHPERGGERTVGG